MACCVRRCAFNDAAVAPCHEVYIGVVDLAELLQLRVQCFDQSLVVVVRGSSRLCAREFPRLLLRCHGGIVANRAKVSNTEFSL